MRGNRLNKNWVSSDVDRRLVFKVKRRLFLHKSQ